MSAGIPPSFVEKHCGMTVHIGSSVTDPKLREHGQTTRLKEAVAEEQRNRRAAEQKAALALQQTTEAERKREEAERQVQELKRQMAGESGSARNPEEAEPPRRTQYRRSGRWPRTARRRLEEEQQTHVQQHADSSISSKAMCFTVEPHLQDAQSVQELAAKLQFAEELVRSLKQQHADALEHWELQMAEERARLLEEYQERHEAEERQQCAEQRVSELEKYVKDLLCSSEAAAEESTGGGASGCSGCVGTIGCGGCWAESI